MLVYKKVTTEWRINNGKKTKSKKVETDTNSHSTETFINKEKPDSSDDGQRKNGPDSIIPDSSGPEEIVELNTENKMDIEIEISSSQDVTAQEMLTSATVDSSTDEQNGKHYESDNKEGQPEAQTKKLFPKIAKIDYRQLNGAAHRAMSCGERDFYEEVRLLRFFLLLLYICCVRVDTLLVFYRWSLRIGKSVLRCAIWSDKKM